MVVMSGGFRSEKQRHRELVERIARQFPELTRVEVLALIEVPAVDAATVRRVPVPATTSEPPPGGRPLRA